MMPADFAQADLVEPPKERFMAAKHSALEPALSAKILLPFCYHFWHTSVRLETKVGESALKSPSLKWKEKQGLPQFCWLFESGLL